MRRLIGMGIAMGCLLWTGCGRSNPKPAPAGESRDPARTASGAKRMVYPWSVVPGGVDSGGAMRAAMDSDPVVAAHYAGLKPEAFRKENLAGKREGHVSFRIGDKVYWTKRKVTLQAGETVLTDGQAMVRGRCGNLISAVSREPVAPAPEEPVETAMDRPALESDLMEVPALTEETPADEKAFVNPKQLAAEKTLATGPPAPLAEEMMPPVWTAALARGPGGGLGGVAVSPGGTAPSNPAAPPQTGPPGGTPADPGTILPWQPLAEVAPPLAIAALLPAPAQPPITGVPAPPIPWAAVNPAAPPPTYIPPTLPPPVVQPPVIQPPGGNPPLPPPTLSTPPDVPPPEFPGDDPPLTPPPPPGLAIPEPDAWLLLVIGIVGVGIGAMRQRF